MIGGIKKIKVFSGKESEFEKLFGELNALVRADEPGNLYYDLYQSRTDAGHYFVLESYRDQAALDAHDDSKHGAVYFPKIRALLESIEVEYFDGIGTL